MTKASIFLGCQYRVGQVEAPSEHSALSLFWSISIRGQSTQILPGGRRQAASSGRLRNPPSSHSAVECMGMNPSPRRKPSATSVEMCSSRSSSSASGLRPFAGFEFGRLGQHAFQCQEIGCVAFRQLGLDFLRERFCLMTGVQNLCLRPAQATGQGGATATTPVQEVLASRDVVENSCVFGGRHGSISPVRAPRLTRACQSRWPSAAGDLPRNDRCASDPCRPSWAPGKLGRDE